jgi:ferredoxin-NADP reductase
MDAPSPGPWQHAAVTDIRVENARTKTFRLQLPVRQRHLAGQHYVVRLTAPDGYTAQRSYSVASPPTDGSEIELTVERLPDGEVSTYLHDEVIVGDTLEVRGPIGGWFVWDATSPALLIGGGSGIVPLMSMLRLARQTASPTSAHLVVSVRAPGDLLYADELSAGDTTVVYSRVAPPGVARSAGRLTVDDLRPHVRPDATTYICGSSGFVESATELALTAGVDSEMLRIERFGPTG